jgi:SAM-dependent methyltransferase
LTACLPLRSNRAMSGRGWETASEIEWEAFYRALEGRALREVFVDATPFMPVAVPGDPALVAVDLGCGDGTETLELLRRGWTVLAVDQSSQGIARLLKSVPPAVLERLTTQVAPYAEVELPPADLVYAGLSLPFCDPHQFDDVWARIATALRPGGLFVGHLFGPHDTWAGTPDMTFHTRAEVEKLFADFDILSLREVDEDGEALSGPKHWHVFHVIARKRGLA